MYPSNFNDIQAHLLNQQLSENDYLNTTTNKETYSNKASDKQKQVPILRIG